MQRYWLPWIQRLWLLFGLTLITFSASKSLAIPAFSRMYGTSCSTCHIDFPKLNDFGKAFKDAGFKFPKDDESMLKIPPVMLGAPANAELWPKAIWPGTIPGQPERVRPVLRDGHFEAEKAQRGGHRPAQEELVVHHEQVPVVRRHRLIAARDRERRVRVVCKFRVNAARAEVDTKFTYGSCSFCRTAGEGDACTRLYPGCTRHRRFS